MISISRSATIIFSQARATNTAPVTDLSTLTGAATTTTVTAPALAAYDSQYVNASSTNANAYTVATATRR